MKLALVLGDASRARGVTEQEVAGPPRLVRLSLEHGRRFTC